MLSGLSSCAGLVLAPKTDRTLKHIEFVNLGPGRALVVLVTEDGLVENRVLEVPLGMPASTLQTASNFLNAKLIGRTLDEARKAVTLEMDEQKTQLDELSSRVVEAGLATWAGSGSTGHLIVRGQAKLLDDVTALSDLERIRALFEALETKEATLRLLDAANKAEGVQIFIGAENTLFSHRRLFADHRAVSEQPRADRGCHRGDRSDTDQLRSHHSHGGLYRQGDRTPARLTPTILFIHQT